MRLQKLCGMAVLAMSATVGAASGQVITGPSTVQSPYILPSTSGVIIESIMSNGNGTTTPDEVYAKTGGGTYRLAGIPDGLGSYDNNDGTFTLLSNHELTSSVGVIRDHGSKGAFVSEWIINKNDLSVVSGRDLMQTPFLWNGTGYSDASAGATITNTVTGLTSKANFSRFCSADLPAVSAFYNASTGLGTQSRIFMDGEENGIAGRSMAHIATGIDKGKSFELPLMGKWSVENNLASPFAQNKTVVVGNADDANNPAIWMYVGNKQSTGNDIERAGLTNGTVSVLRVNGLAAETRAFGLSTTTYTTHGTFDFVNLGNTANVPAATQQSTGLAGGATKFARSEDGTWDPRPGHQNDYYFVTTDQFNTITRPSTPGGPANQDGRSRLWRMRYNDITNPSLGGQIDMLIDGGISGVEMFDNLTMDKRGRILLNEDPGNTAYRGKVWMYNTDNSYLLQIAEFDPARYGDNSGPGGSLVGGVAPFITGTTLSDKETTGIIDASDILGDGWFLVNVQAHYAQTGPNATELVEGGQTLALYLNPNVVPEPSSFVLLSMASLFGIAYCARRRRQKSQSPAKV